MTKQTARYVIEEVDRVPEKQGRKGPRASESRDILDALHASQSGQIRLKFEDKVECNSFYKAFIQFRLRHSLEESVGMRKDGLVLYLWLIQPSLPAQPTPDLPNGRLKRIPRKRRLRRAD